MEQDRAAVSTDASTERCVLLDFSFLFNNVHLRTRFAKTCKWWKNIPWTHHRPCWFCSPPLSIFSFTINCPLPSTPLSLPCLCFTFGQRLPLCVIQFQSRFCDRNPPCNTASISQLILSGCLIMSWTCILRMTTFSVTCTPRLASANLCDFYTDSFKQYIQM